MLPAPRASLTANSAEFETFPLVKPTGFREYDARWWFGIPGAAKDPELNLLGVQALGTRSAAVYRTAAARAKRCPHRVLGSGRFAAID